jgi:hypothetical protein
MYDVQTKPPGKVQALGIMHLIGGILNIIASLAWAAAGLLTGIMTFGIGLIYCCPAVILLPIGILELMSGIKHMSKDHSTLAAPRMTGIVELGSILGCGTFSFIFGVLTLVFLADEEVKAYYAARGGA